MRLSTLLFGIIAAATTVFAAPIETTTAPSTSTDLSSCALKDSPAATSTKLAFAGAKDLYQFIFGSITQGDPTHSELEKVSAWQLGQVKKLYDQAIALNKGDTKKPRKLFYTAKLGFLKLEITTADAMLKKGLPKYPWLGKAISWVMMQWKKIQEVFHRMFGGSKPATAGQSTVDEQGAMAMQQEDANEAIHFLDEQEARLTELDQHFAELDNEENDRCEF